MPIIAESEKHIDEKMIKDKNKSWKKKLVPALLLAVILAAFYVIAADPRLPGFYSVPDSDVDVCSKWGGLFKPLNVVARQGFEQIKVATAITLMGEKTRIHLENYTTTLYKFNWYIESGTKQNIKITAKGKNTEKALLDTDITAGSPITSYYSQYIEEDYDVLELIYGAHQTTTIPIVEVS